MLDDARIFVTVSELKSFSKAASKLKLTAPIVTRHISALEKNIGAKLFQRSTRHVTLTEAGIVFYEHCLDLLRIYQLSLDQVKNLNHEIVGTLKIGLPFSLSHLFVTPNLNSFLKKYPHLKIDIVTGNHLIDLLSAGFDMVVHCGELADSSLYSRKIGEWTKVTCAAPSYLKRFGTPKHPQDLMRHECLDHYDNRQSTWNYLIDEKISPVSVSGPIRCNNSMELKNLALAGNGIVYLPSFTVQDELKSQQLKAVLTAFAPGKLPIYVVYTSKVFLAKKVEVFISYLAKMLEI